MSWQIVMNCNKVYNKFTQWYNKLHIICAVEVYEKTWGEGNNVIAPLAQIILKFYIPWQIIVRRICDWCGICVEGYMYVKVLHKEW